MKTLQLRSQRFRAEREADWRRLETLLAKAEGGGVRRLSDDELLEIPVRYRSVVSALSVARATSLDASLADYLEGLVTRAYFFVYGVRTSLGDRVSRFFREDWPGTVRGLWRECLIAGAILVLTAIAGYVLVSQDLDWYGSIMPGEMTQGRDPTASTAYLRQVLYDDHGRKGLEVFATFLFTHNAQVAIMAFALGFAFCVPTALLIAQTGLSLGALIALYASRGMLFQIGGWLIIHGTTELMACVIGGAAGFRIGWAVAFPGDRSRLDAASAAGRSAGAAMAGVVIMLVVAGILEGVGRQTVKLDWGRYGIGAAMFVLWLAYFALARRKSPT